MKKFLICIFIIGILIPHTGCGQQASEETNANIDSKDSQKVSEGNDENSKDIGYTIVDESYETEKEEKDGYQQVNIHVPVIKEIDNLGIAEHYNELLGNKLADFESGALKIKKGEYYHLDYEIATMNSEILSIIFRGKSYFENQSSPKEFAYTYNISIKNKSTVCFSENNDVKKTAELLVSGEKLKLVDLERTKDMKLEDYMQVLQSSSIDEWIKKLDSADYRITLQEDGTFLNENDSPNIYSYVKEDQTILVIEVKHVMRDYVEILLP